MEQKIALLTERPKWVKKPVAKKALILSCGCILVSMVVALTLLVIAAYSFPHYLQYLVFQQFQRFPIRDYKNVTASNVKSLGRNFYLRGEEGKIGVWHMLPMSLTNKYRERGTVPTNKKMEALMGRENNTIIIYAHGNSFDRTVDHRCELYNVLTEMNYHVIAFDYRGYGDSDGSPTEEGLSEDSKVVYEYVRRVAGNNVVIVWGHSMGTGVSARFVHDLSVEGNPPDGLVLESAFNNLHDLIYNHPFGFPFRHLPIWIYEKLVTERFRSIGFTMRSDKYIKRITCPILVAHAADDHVIPAALSRKLVAAAKLSKRDVEYVEFHETRLFAHKFIYLAEELPGLVRRFLDKCETIKSFVDL